MVEVDADREAIAVSKHLLDCAELAAIETHDGATRRWIYTRSLPSLILKEGVYRLPLVLVEEVEQGLAERVAQRQHLIDTFMGVYPVKVEEARGRLRALYDPQDYPGEEVVGAAFDCSWRYLSIGIPQTLSLTLMAREREKAAAAAATEMDEIRRALRTSFAELVQHAAERLAPTQDGKPRVFRDSLVRNMEDFLQYFEARNLTHDTDLVPLVEQARSVLRGVTPDELRTQDGVRQQVQRTMAEIKRDMDEGTLLKPTRRFTMQEVGSAS